MDFEIIGESLSLEIAFSMQGLNNPDMPRAEKSDLVNSLIHQTQALAIMVLLVKHDVMLFRQNLIRSAQLRQSFLVEWKQAGLSQAYHQCAGRIQGVLSAIVARDYPLVAAIVDVTPTDFRKQMEYEDDYCYAQCVHYLALQHFNQNQIRSLLLQFEQCAGESSRYEVVAALIARDQEGFEHAFVELLVDHEAAIEKDRKRGQLEEPDVLAQRHVFLEGLALLNLAEHQGLAVRDHYRYCPALAREPVSLSKPLG